MGTEKSRIALLYVTERGKAQGEKISNFLPVDIFTRLTKEVLGSLWPKVDQIIIIGSLGIATRYVAPMVKDKAHDPGVVVVDEWGRFSVSLLSGHLGGANRLALTLGHRLNARPVITTSSDLIGLYPPDLWALENQLVVEDRGSLKDVSRRLVGQGYLKVYLEGVNLGMPEHYIKTADPKEADLIVSFRDDSGFLNRPLLRPKVLYVGIGFNSGTRGERIYECLKEVFIRNGLSLLSVDSLATIDKKREDPHFSGFLEDYGFSCRFYTPEELNRVEIKTPSEGVYGSVGAYGVSEPAAILASQGGRLLVPKTKFGDVTVSVALKGADEKRGRLNVVGIGPGGIEYLLPIARKAILEAEVIVGYQRYLRQIEKLTLGKEIYSTGMMAEVERCRKAIWLALSGKDVALVSGGDPNVYGMAGLVLQILSQEFPHALQEIELGIIPGISALNIASALLGGALMHDFSCISLSDRLTPWELIKKRLVNSADADMVIVLYNPRSHSRKGLLEEALNILRKFRSPETPVGIVKGATRENQSVKVVRLEEVDAEEVDMETTLVVGNSQSFAWQGKMITPRGYRL